MSVYDESLVLHEEKKGKIEVISRVQVKNAQDLSLAYTPGVAQPCLEIEKDPDLSYKYTRRANMIAVISDGSAVLGLGNIGHLASMPVMEGKCVLFKTFCDVDAFPIVINESDPDVIIKTIISIADSFGGINLEDMSAPRCFLYRACAERKNLTSRFSTMISMAQRWLRWRRWSTLIKSSAKNTRIQKSLFQAPALREMQSQGFW